ncbi:hypothetical protein NCU16714 [Neurospora crassa OR74A]|uniref:Uncharacterized protein n=1 Tax=Neurospora crassa (strain ATCC 24698 / 74-OR23-1A / CBS 708.71 / DSM 1257 / FGSC 987) TaxID=367110 RepID=U9WHE2_NEUCR|nr:hypothetical protein NCU16714 [Neurospora crassa OR74A]ESA43468.1 hypothetical protein NCU16714 [Neurospora crassa OR74A]|eukprot:XP_011394075.1 hypothetical protein NCU16714 [Neurospora crassa OR74A]
MQPQRKPKWSPGHQPPVAETTDGALVEGAREPGPSPHFKTLKETLLHERQRMYACVGIIPVGARGAKGGIGDISMKNYWTITTGPRTGDNDSGSAVLEHKITGGYLDCKWEPARLSLGTCGVPRVMFN